MTKLLFATNNKNKIIEMQAAIGNLIQIIGLKSAGIEIDIPEPYDRLEDNAAEKSSTIFALTGMSCFSEDTGLEVAALNGLPGAKSARFAGEGKSADDNIDKLLKKLEGVTDRKARFRTVISLIWKGENHFFEGTCDGEITLVRKGTLGFGYDPVFMPLGSTKTFGEMTIQEKNAYSHRKKAAAKLVLFLQQHD